jgi:hypothetical protein
MEIKLSDSLRFCMFVTLCIKCGSFRVESNFVSSIEHIYLLFKRNDELFEHFFEDSSINSDSSSFLNKNYLE